MIRSSKLLRRPKQLARTWVYPFQRRLPVTLANEAETRAVMIFDATTKYGGWMDRVKGIVSVYELARLTGRRFQMYAGATFPLSGLVEPATFDWRVEREALRWNPLATGFHVSRDRWIDAFPKLRNARWRTLFMYYNATAVQASITAGKIAFDGAAAAACVASFGAPVCTTYWTEGPDFGTACDTAMVGKVATGAACTIDFECSGETWCDDATNKCAPYPAGE